MTGEITTKKFLTDTETKEFKVSTVYICILLIVGCILQMALGNETLKMEL